MHQEMDETSDFGTQAIASFTLDLHVVDPVAQPTAHIKIRTVSWCPPEPLN